jgi:iron complex outermembrane receptor protein
MNIAPAIFSERVSGLGNAPLRCIAVFSFAFWANTARADPAGSTAEETPIKEATSHGEVTPPRLIHQVELTYPTEALKSLVHGDVSVLVEVDVSGRVAQARLEEGDEIFKQAALEAANRLEFEPARRDGVPVRVTTRVWFHFAPPVDFEDAPGMEVFVHAESPDRADTHSRTTLDQTQIERSAGENLAATVSQVAGVHMAQGTSDAAKPVIRGQQERRLLILMDGVRHESQKWGPDHGTEIDPFSAGEVSVIRGAAGARYGPDALGGVILVDPPPMRTEAGVGGKALTSFASNGLRPYGAFRLDGASESIEGLTVRVEGNGSVGASKSTPTYVLGNTGSKTWNAGGAVSYTAERGSIRATLHHHDFQGGGFYGVRSSTPDDFATQVEASKPVNADLWTSTYSIDRPYQDVTHDIGLLKGILAGEWGSVETIYAFQLNQRLEFEQVRDSVTGPQYDFTLRTHSLDSVYLHPEIQLNFGDLEGGVGIQGSFQENVYRGYSLMPNYRGFGGGIFGFERLTLPRFDVDLAARWDGLSRAAYMSDDDYQRHVSRGSLNETVCTTASSSMRCPGAYDSGSFSFGVLSHVIPDRFDLKLDLSSASRFPNVDELYLLGNAPSFPVYALGNPDLGVETAWGSSLTAELLLEALQLEISGFGQLVEDYIYFAPDFNENGEPRFDVTIQGAWPRYVYRPIDAVVYGVDGRLSIAPESLLGLDLRGSVVRTTDRETGDHLVGTPPDSLHVTLVCRPSPLGRVHEMEFAVNSELIAAQSRVDPTNDFAAAPDGYALFGASIDFTVGHQRPVRVGMEAHNIFNTSYRDYTSLLRYYADQPGRDVRMRVGMDF